MRQDLDVMCEKLRQIGELRGLSILLEAAGVIEDLQRQLNGGRPVPAYECPVPGEHESNMADESLTVAAIEECGRQLDTNDVPPDVLLFPLRKTRAGRSPIYDLQVGEDFSIEGAGPEFKNRISVLVATAKKKMGANFTKEFGPGAVLIKRVS